MPGYTVVLIEDEKDLRDLLSEALEQESFQVKSFANGEDFLNQRSNLRANIIVTDVCLPGVSGMELISEVRKADKKTPILLMTGVPKDGDGAKALSQGADDYLEKPVNIEFLTAKVRRLIERSNNAQSADLPGFSLSLPTNELIVNGDRVKFTGTEFEVFKYLFENLNDLVPRSTLEAHTSKARSLDVHIHAIRRKIKELPLSVDTLKMKGYRLRVTADLANAGEGDNQDKNLVNNSGPQSMRTH